MEIWLDSTNVCAIQKAIKIGLLSGVTTNPALIVEAQRSLEDILDDLMHYQEGPVAVQVNEGSVSEMVQQGQNLYSYSTRVIIKVPMTKEGLEAIYLLSRQGIPTMATAIFHSHQVLTAALAGADFVAPYLSKMVKAGCDPWSMLKTSQQILQNYRLKTKVLGASISTIDQIINCATVGIYGITLKENIFSELVGDQPLTMQALQAFADIQCGQKFSLRS